MNAYEIPDWINKKIKRTDWEPEEYIELRNGRWCFETGELFDPVECLFNNDDNVDWLEYKKYTKVILYRYTHKDSLDEQIYQSLWTDKDFKQITHSRNSVELLKTETKEVEL